MKKKILCVFLCLITFLSISVSLTACKKDNNRCLYDIEATYNDTENTLYAEMDFTYFNDTENEISTLKFNMFGNAYRQDATIKPVSSAYNSVAYYDGMDYGEMTISEVKNVLSFAISGQDKNILSVTLTKSVFPDEKAEITICFSLKLAKVNHRTGVTKNCVNLGNFYPVLCAYDNGFYECAYYSNGDPFYSVVADYKINLTAPKNLVVASSGEIVSTSAVAQNISYNMELNNARDFAIVMSENFSVATEEYNGVKIFYYYYNDDDFVASLKIAKESFKYYYDFFGKYPYKTLSVTQTGFCYGGMEYPALTMISDRLNRVNYNYTIAHENAHQWWYSAVGNNQLDNAWMDEGLTEYSTVMFYENHSEYGLTREKLIDSMTKSYKAFYSVYNQIFGNANTSMNRNLKDYMSDYEYSNVSYNKGTILFDNLRISLGDDRFKNGLKSYYSKYIYKIAKPEDMAGCFEKMGVDVGGFFASYINGKVII